MLCFDGDSAGQKAAVRAAMRALPHVAPGRSLGFVTLPPGQDPDDLIKASGRAAFDALLETPESLVERLWRHELDAEPLKTPEQKAGLRRRLMDHVGAIGDPDVRDQYRAEFLRRFEALTASQRKPWTPGPRGRFVPPPRPTSAAAKSARPHRPQPASSGAQCCRGWSVFRP